MGCWTAHCPYSRRTSIDARSTLLEHKECHPDNVIVRVGHSLLLPDWEIPKTGRVDFVLHLSRPPSRLSSTLHLALHRPSPHTTYTPVPLVGQTAHRCIATSFCTLRHKTRAWRFQTSTTHSPSPWLLTPPRSRLSHLTTRARLLPHHKAWSTLPPPRAPTRPSHKPSTRASPT